MRIHLKAASLASLIAICLSMPFLSQTAYSQALRTDIKIAIPEEPPTLDPCAIVTVGPSRILAGNVVEGLTQRVPGGAELKPLLATAWSQTSPTTWDFTLRQGVTFHDGEAFNAAAAAASINRTFMPKLNCSVMTLAFGAVKVTAEAVGDYDLKITTNQVDPLLPFRASFFGMTSPKTQTDRQTEDPIGTGPYKFVRWDHGNSVTLARNDSYWGPKPQLETATYLFRSEDTVRAGMIDTGEADIAMALSPEYGKNKGARNFPIPVSVALRMDTQSAPFNDMRVRHAIDLAIDRQGLIDAVWNGEGRVASQIITPETFGYDPELKPSPYDPDAAKKLIAAAKADGVPVDKPVKIYNRVDLYPNADLFAQALSQQLNAIGLNTQVQEMEAAAWIERLLAHASPDRSELLIDPHQNALGDAWQSVNARFDSSQGRNRVPKELQPKVDAMVKAAGAATGDERAKLYQQLLAYISSDVMQDSYIAYLSSTMILSPKVHYTPDSQSYTIVRLSSIQVDK